MGVKPEHIRTLDDLKLLPFTTKQDLRDNYPFGMFAVPMDAGGPDSRLLGHHRQTHPGGLHPAGPGDLVGADGPDPGGRRAHRGDIVHNAYGYGLFTGGLGFHYGAERMGAAVIPVSGGNTQRQIMLMQDFGPTILVCTPSFALYLAEVGQEMGVDFAASAAQGGHLRGRALERGHAAGDRKATQPGGRGHLRALRGHRPGRRIECIEAKAGAASVRGPLHPRRSSIPRRETEPAGETGELVFTTLTKEAFPLLRYRTRDITSLIYAPCACGRTIVRMERLRAAPTTC